MKLKEALIAWDPDSGKVKVGYWPDKTGWSKEYLMSGGACYTEYRDANEKEAMLYIHRDMTTLVIRDNINPLIVHNEFLKIEEYEKCLTPDTPRAKV